MLTPPPVARTPPQVVSVLGSFCPAKASTELEIGRLERDINNLKIGYETGQRDGERFWKAVQEHWAITPERAAQEAKA